MVEYDDVRYPGVIEDSRAGQYLVNVMESCRGGWRWPRRKDCVWYTKIIKILLPLVPANSRGLFLFKDTV